MIPALFSHSHSANAAPMNRITRKRWGTGCLAICPVFVALQAAMAWQAPLAVPLDGKWDLVAVTGKTQGSSFVAKGAPIPSLEVSYVFANVDPNSSENPDEKGADRFKVALKGEWDLSGFSWAELTVTGDGSHFVTALGLTDAAGKSAIYQRIPLADRGKRTYGFTLGGPGSLDQGFDASKVREVAIFAIEGGENRYVVNKGSFRIGGIVFSNKDREDQIVANLTYAAEVGKGTPGLDVELEAAGKSLAARTGSLTDLEVQSALLKRKALFPDAAGSLPFVVCSLSPMEKVRPSFFNFLGRPAGAVALDAAANEYESAQLIIVPQASGAKGIAASVVDDLVGPDGNRIDRKNIEVRRAGFVKTTPTCYAFVDYVGEVEDPLMPNGLIEIPGDRVQPVWFTVHIPDGTKPGLYQTRVRFSGVGHLRDIPMSVKVRGFSLPRTSAVSRQVYYWLPAIANWYGFRNGKDSCDYHKDGFDVPVDIIKEQLAFLLKYRLDVVNVTWPFNAEDGTPNWPLKVRPDGSLDFSLHDELLEFCRERGMRHFSVGDFGRSTTRIFDPTYRKNVERVMKPYLVHLSEKGWIRDGYFKVYDEPDNKAGYDALVEECTFIRSLSPEVKTLAAIAQPEGRTKGLVDVFLFRPNNWSDDAAAAIRKGGDVASWYWCATPFSKPFPNYFVNYPGTDPRVIEWMHFKYKCPVFLYWAVNNWDHNFKAPGEARWPEVPWNPNTYATFNGDGQLVYPWPDGTLAGSVRLENLRDGAEDLECFTLLRDAAMELERSGKRPELAAEAKKLLTLDAVVQSPISYDADPAAINETRRKADSLLEEINGTAP
jgi:hypothetical protein